LQEIDYDGWPEPHEIPIQHMTNEHKEALVANCSRKKDIIMPVFTASPSKENKVVSNTVTPLPNGATQTAGQKHGLSTVTPSPVVGLAVAKGKAGPDKLSKQSLEMHRKWKKDAEALGTTGGLVTGRPEAKVLIFKFMEDSFRPMNITDIYKVSNSALRHDVIDSDIATLTPNRFVFVFFFNLLTGTQGHCSQNRLEWLSSGHGL
jgi:hypothetical protein